MIGIMAMSENRCIGLNGKLPFHSSGDFKWFKEFTMGKTLIVGRKTFDNLPLLKGRKIWILTNDIWRKMMVQRITNSLGCEGRKYNYDVIMDYNKEVLDECIVAGGKSIYELFMPYITEFYVTILDLSVNGDTFMSEFEHLFSKQEVIREFEGGKVIKYSK